METKLSTGRLNCIISAIIVFGSYIAQRVIDIATDETRTVVLVQAFCFTLATVIVYFLIARSNECYYGILMALFGIRMMPPDIPMLDSFSVSAGFIYFIVKKFAIVLFVFSIIRLYREQKSDKALTPIPILALIAVVPFFNEIKEALSTYMLRFTGNMLYSYFSQFAVFSFAMVVLLIIACKSNNNGARLICEFQLVALLLNAGRRACAIAITLANGGHISRSYYCWIAIYVVFFVAFCIERNKNVIEKI